MITAPLRRAKGDEPEFRTWHHFTNDYPMRPIPWRGDRVSIPIERPVSYVIEPPRFEPMSYDYQRVRIVATDNGWPYRGSAIICDDLIIDEVSREELSPSEIQRLRHQGAI